MTQPSPGISKLALRLAAWFILLTSLPLLVLVFFSRQNVQTMFEERENTYHYELATILASQVAASGTRAESQRLLLTLADTELNAFIMAGDGAYLAHTDTGKINRMAHDDFSPEAIQVILSQRDGLYSEPLTPNFFAFAPVAGQDAVVVISGTQMAISETIFQLERTSYPQLLVAALIMFVASGVVIWLLVALPVKRLTRAAQQFGAGQLDVRVDPHEMIDDLAVLATAFNTMAGRIRELVGNLEQRVAARTEELSTFFDLTVLTGQAANVSEVFDQALPRILEVTCSRTVCLHLLDEDRTCLRLIAHQNMPDLTRAALQSVPVPPDFQAWLQQPNEPLLTSRLVDLDLLPAPLRLPGYHSYLGAQIRAGDRIDGLLSCYRLVEHGFGLDEVSLVVALAEQFGLVLETQRLRQTAEEAAVLGERQRLARDLHDSVTQSLYSMSLFSRAGREAAEDGDTERLKLSLAELEETTVSVLREMRLLLYELRPADLEKEGLARAIELRLDTVERRTGLTVAVQIDDLPGMPPAFEVELFHIILEALNNVVKHSQAARVSLSLVHEDGQVRLLIVDDGRGFEPSRKYAGLGLSSIRDRVARSNGRLDITSQPGSGTRLEAVIPQPKEEG